MPECNTRVTMMLCQTCTWPQELHAGCDIIAASYLGWVHHSCAEELPPLREIQDQLRAAGAAKLHDWCTPDDLASQLHLRHAGPAGSATQWSLKGHSSALCGDLAGLSLGAESPSSKGTAAGASSASVITSISASTCVSSSAGGSSSCGGGDSGAMGVKYMWRWQVGVV